MPIQPASQPLIEDHALIGDMRSAALVAKDGTIDWLCLPAFDSDACFASLLGTADNGRWTIAPRAPVREVQRRYRQDTMILETDFITDHGTLRLIDFMVPNQDTTHVVRTITSLGGKVPVHVDFSPRLAFGWAVPKLTTGEDYTRAIAGPDALYLRGGPSMGAPRPQDDFTVSPGNPVSYVLTWGRPYKDVPKPVEPVKAERETARFWVDWCSQIQRPARYGDLVVRSLLTLKACTFRETGGIVAAPTTSLPETPGGIRNWDYRFTWLRDSALAVRAMMVGGLTEEAFHFRDWIVRAVAGDPKQIQIMYGIRGERRLTESELPWLAGYGGARPVRIGNEAYQQFQLDVFGEVGDAMSFAFHKFGRINALGAEMLMQIADFVSGNWQTQDHGIWEMRGPVRSFTSSKVSAWMAINAAIQVIEKAGLEHPLDKLKKVRQEIHDEVCEKGFNKEKNCFTQYYGGTDLDGSLLAIPMAGFLPATDPRVVGTVEAIERELMDDGLVLRFRPVGDVDGLKGEEGVFLACSFWLVNTYKLMGRHEEAEALFERLIGLANDVGLLSEEYDPKEKRQLGNFPQAFSHFALIESAYLLNAADMNVAAEWPEIHPSMSGEAYPGM